MFPRVNGLRTMELGSPGEMRSRLNGLVLSGEKSATAGILVEYEREGEQVETVGERLVLVDDDGAPVGTVVVTAVEVVPFGQVTWEFAQAEGEGFTSAEDWRVRHLRYWTSIGLEVTDDSPLACLGIALA